VTACLLPQTECGEPAVGLESIDLLVQIGPDRWLRVPAAAMPALAAVERDPATLLGGFVLQTRCRPRPLAAAPRGFLAWSPPPDGTTLRLHSSAEEFTDSTGTLGRVLLTPLAAVADAAWWILKHGPFDFDLLRGDPCGARPVLAPIGAR
jgi:hypothetical protein